MKGFNKRFNIGEFALGGIIDISIIDNVITINAIDNITRKKLKSFIVIPNHLYSYGQTLNILIEITNYYHAKIILNYIEKRISLTK